jgi:hypothetical protein
MVRRPPPPLTPEEKERAVDEIVEELAGRLGVPVERARALLYALTTVMKKHGITLEAAIEALTDPPPPKPN